MEKHLYGIIDIGSNSVRLMISNGAITLSKENTITKLAEGQSEDLLLDIKSIERTALAVSFYCKKAKDLGADKIYAFATQAVRGAKNKAVFIEMVKTLCDIDIEVLSGEREAEIGFLGATCGNNGGVIDIGGASTEIIVKCRGAELYKKSVDVGCVKLNGICGQNQAKIEDYLAVKLNEYGNIPSADFFAIGGTATSISAIAQNLTKYDAKKTHGYTLTLDKLKEVVTNLSKMSVEGIKDISCIQPQRAEVIFGGAILLEKIMEKINLDKITVSERDNLEGYLDNILEKK